MHVKIFTCYPNDQSNLENFERSVSKHLGHCTDVTYLQSATQHNHLLTAILTFAGDKRVN